MASEKNQPHKCPECGSSSIRRSRKTLLDRLRALAYQKPYRCGKCRRRFYLLAESATPAATKPTGTRTESRDRKRALHRRELLIYAVALMIFTVAALVLTTAR